MKKIIYVVLDGLGDDPLPQLKDRTPLEAARTPNLDALASRGRNGTVYTVGKGLAPESDVAVFSILGYDPRVYHAGRGPMEGLGAGMEIHDGDLVYRINFATVDGDGRTIVDRRVGRNLSSDESKALAAEANAKIKLPGASATLLATVEHRGVLLIRRDRPLSAEVTNTDPAYERVGALGVAKETFEDIVQTCEPLPGHEGDERAQAAADLTNEYLRQCFAVLDASDVNAKRRAVGSMPGNIILTRDGGDHLPKPPSFRERFGAEWGCFVEMPVERGISMVLGMGQIEVPMMTGSYDEQYRTWAETALESIEGYDGLYIHIKGPDVPAHDGRFEEKLRNIEAIDESFFGLLLSELRNDVILAVTADHSTSCAKKAHTDDPVPLIVAGPGVGSDAVSTFGERAAVKGSIGLVQGLEIMPRLMDLARD
ncbi:MAG TPA: alkaline phosphatase family protein [Actinomycetota bacterium]|nr:alkaline phosphatase family protein [Actinomycetota bacterium]